MSFPIQPVLRRQAEEQQISGKKETQKKFKEQAEKIKTLQTSYEVSLQTAKSLENRVKELEEINHAMSLQLRGAEEANGALISKVGQQAHLLLQSLQEQNKATKECIETLNKKIAEVSGVVIGGAIPADGFYDSLSRLLDQEERKHSKTLETLKDNSQAFDAEVKLRKELCDNHNEVKTSNQVIERSFKYLGDLKGVPEEVRKLSQHLNDIQATLTGLKGTDFLTADKETIATIKQRFILAFNELQTVSKAFDTLARSDNARDLIARINKIADTALIPIGHDDLEQYEFYTTVGREATTAQLNTLSRTDQERYVELRKLLSEQWNKIIQQISHLYCESNLLSDTLELHLPLIDHHKTAEQLYSDLRHIRRSTPSNPNADNVDQLRKHLTQAKSRFLEILKTQNALTLKYNAQMKPRESEEFTKTLVDRIKDETAQIDKQTEFNSSLKNKATQEGDVDQQLTALHKELQRKYEDFMKKITDLWTLIDAQGSSAALELMRLEDAIANNGVFTTQIYYMTKEKTSNIIGLGTVPPYKSYWYNPEDGIAKMTAAPQAPATDAQPQPV